MSAADQMIDRCVSITRATGPSFASAWERIGANAFRLRATGEIFSHAFANMVLQDVAPGSVLEAVV